LVYFHPPGIIHYHSIIDQWVEQTAQLKAAGQFRWYTMTEMANFMNTRKSVRWKVAQKDGRIIIDAEHPVTLQHLTWWLPGNKYSRPEFSNGSGAVFQAKGGWIVVAGNVKQLQIAARMIP
jgi:hypothetical protein